MSVALIGAFGVLLVAVIAIYGKSIAGWIFKEGIAKRYAIKAVETVEWLVTLSGEVKFKTALEWALAQIRAKWRLPIGEELMAYWIEWAVSKMKRDGLEIKKEKVLPVDHPALKIKRGEFSIGFEKQF